MTARCFDTLHGTRCARALGHTGVHRAEGRFWQTRDLPVPAWRRSMVAKDLTGRAA
jgi:hypothetical protein